MPEHVIKLTYETVANRWQGYTTASAEPISTIKVSFYKNGDVEIGYSRIDDKLEQILKDRYNPITQSLYAILSEIGCDVQFRMLDWLRVVQAKLRGTHV